MGVTLERVQNKFACIIGELCSEPVILSQFAIWVDLRIAEYKAKGAISLECSGEDPDPAWMKGHKPARTKRELTPGRHPGRMMADNSIQRTLSDSLAHSDMTKSDDAAARLSPDCDIVVIKEEPEDNNSVFPVSLHRHENAMSNRNITPRKRTSADPSLPSDGRHSPSKLRKLSPASPALHVEPVNQSLMSIISEGALEESGDSSANFTLDYSSLDPANEDSSATTSLFQSQPVATTSSGDLPEQQDNSNTVPEHPTTSVSATPSLSSSPSSLTSLPRIADNPTRSVQAPARPRLHPSPAKRSWPSKSVKSRIVNVGNKSSTTVGNLVGAVSKLENWLSVNHQDMRRIEEIPPVQLDNYLVMFFSILKNRHGCDYDPESFSNFRSFLERFLKERGYPASLSSSSVFANSQAIYNDKRRALMKAAVERRRAKHRQYFLNLQLAAAIAQQHSAQESFDEPEDLSTN